MRRKNNDCRHSFQSINKWLCITLWSVLGVSIIFGLLNVFFGNLNQDEGWYLYAAQQVTNGKYPYLDFFYTQGPIMPFVYAVFGWFWEPLGILGGRVLTLIFGLLSTAFAGLAFANCIRNHFERRYGIIAVWCLLGCNLYHSYFTSIPKTYALTGLFISFGFYALTLLMKKQRNSEYSLPPIFAVLSGISFALAAGVRISHVFLLPVIFIWLIVYREKIGRFAWLWFALASGISFFAIFAYPLFLCPEQFFFANMFHVGRESSGIFGIIGSMARLIRFYPLIFALGIGIAIKHFFVKDSYSNQPGNRGCFVTLWLCCFACVAMVQLLSPVPYDDYQVPLMILPAMSVAYGIMTLPRETVRRFAVYTLAVLSIFIFSISSPIVQDWFVVRQDGFFVKLKSETDLRKLQKIAKKIKREIPIDDSGQIFTQDTYLAVEAGLSVPAGMEMGPFSFFYELPTETATKNHVLNATMMLDLIENSSIDIAAVSGYTFMLNAPKMEDMRQETDGRCYLLLQYLKNRYKKQLFKETEFGQHHTTLFVLKGESDEN